MLRVIKRLIGGSVVRSSHGGGRPTDAGTNMVITKGLISGQVLGYWLTVRFDETFGKWYWCAEVRTSNNLPISGSPFDGWDAAWWDGVQTIEAMVFGDR